MTIVILEGEMKSPLKDKNSDKEFMSGRRWSLNYLRYFWKTENVENRQENTGIWVVQYILLMSLNENSHEFSAMNCCLILAL